MHAKDQHTLRTTAHSLKPVVLLGTKGLTSAVLQEIDMALNTHELIKIKLTGVEREDKKELIATICQKLSTELVQQIGHIAVLYRKNLSLQNNSA